MTTPLSVGWLNWSGRDCPPLCPALELVPLRREELARIAWDRPGAQAVVIDIDHADAPGAAELKQVIEQCPRPVLVRIPADRLADLLPLVRSGDDLCSRDDPPEWLAHRVRRLLSVSDLDPLTQVLHRRAFRDRAAAALAEASAERPLSLVFVELDHFALVNKDVSFVAGDRVLEATARLLQSGGSVLAARLGGDEFAVLVPGANETDAARYASELCRAVRENRSADGLTVTASLGVVTVEQCGPSVDEVFQNAVTAMYAAKGRGRDQAVHFRELEREAARSGSDVQVRAFEVHQRLVTERATENITLRGRVLLQELQRRADHDSLTGLFNRGYLDRRLPRDCEEARGANRPLCVALIDVDHFGQVNKTHGWPTGDQTLRDVADVIRQNVRAGDWVAKYGGEEIAVVLAATPEEAAVVVERIRCAVAGHTFRTTKGEPHAVTVSAGVVAAEAGEDATRLWDRVSRKVLEAKAAGRNQVRA